MSIFSFFSASARPAKIQRKRKAHSLRIESLEDRCVPSSSPLGDLDSNSTVNGGAATPAAGNAQPQSAALTKTVNFNSTPTDFSLQGVLDQFDPTLGTLQSIQITHAGSITSQIQVENT